jgi:hypothetical protein
MYESGRRDLPWNASKVWENIMKRNYHLLNYNPWTDKPASPETPEQKADRKRREAEAAKKFEKSTENLNSTVDKHR